MYILHIYLCIYAVGLSNYLEALAEELILEYETTFVQFH